VQDQPVVRVAAEGLRDDFLELRFNLVDRLAWSETGAVANAEDMGVDRECFFAERGVEDHVRGLAADSGQRLEILPRARDLAAIFVDQRLAERDHILRLGVEQADRLDLIAKRILADREHLPGCFHALEQVAGGEIDADVGRLGRQHHGNQQLVGIARFELGCRRRVRLRQPPEKFENLGARHKEPITSRIE
jgi:hypothetical protein